MRKVIKIVKQDTINDDIKFWKNKTPEERLEAIEFLRAQLYGILGFKKIPRMKKVLTLRYEM